MALFLIVLMLGLDFLLAALGVWVIIGILHWVGVALTIAFSWKLALAAWCILMLLRVLF